MSVMDGISGTFAMARGETGWAERMDLSAGAVFASFLAVPLCLPAIILQNEVARQLQGELLPGMVMPGPVGAAVLGVLTSLTAWAGALFVLTRLASRAEAGWRVTPLLIGYNWSRLIANVAGGLSAAAGIALGSAGILGFGNFLALVLAVWLEFGVVKRALALDTGPTVGVMMMLLLVRVLAIILIGTIASPFLPSQTGT